MSHIYMLWNPELGSKAPVKIGRTANPAQRMSQLEIGSPGMFVAHFWKVNDAVTVEEFIHQALDKYRIRGEWFSDVSIGRTPVHTLLNSISLYCACSACEGFYNMDRITKKDRSCMP